MGFLEVKLEMFLTNTGRTFYAIFFRIFMAKPLRKQLKPFAVNN